MTAPALTPRQAQALAFIRNTVQERGYPPSLREIADERGQSSPTSAHRLLVILQDRGYIRRDPGIGALAILDPAEAVAP